MALIRCEECGSSISDRAASCPKCGNPSKPKVQTVQQTGKEFKAIMLLSGLAMIGGCVGMISQPKPGYSDICVLVFVVSILVFILARLGAWWHHG